MANGDAAAAAGMDILNPATALVKDGADEINKTRDYVATRAQADGGWIPVTVFGSGFAGLANPHTPRIRRVGHRVDLFGTIVYNGGTGASLLNMLTIPAGYRLGGAYASMFLGAVVTSQNIVVHLWFNADGTIGVHPSNAYRTGAINTGANIPLVGSWFDN